MRGVLALLAFPTLVLVVSAGTLGQTTPTAAAEVDALTGSFRMALLEAGGAGERAGGELRDGSFDLVL